MSVYVVSFNAVCLHAEQAIWAQINLNLGCWPNPTVSKEMFQNITEKVCFKIIFDFLSVIFSLHFLPLSTLSVFLYQIGHSLCYKSACDF